MGDTTIEYAKQAKYLGIWLDSRLSFAHHVQEKASTAYKVASMLHRTVSKTWGMTPSKARWVYTAMVRPVIDYGCLVWIKAAGVKRNMAALQKVQRAACVAITSAMKSAPTAALEVMLNIKPIDLHLQEKAVLTSIRLQSQGNWQTTRTNLAKGSLRTHVDIINDLRQPLTKLRMPWDFGKGKFLNEPTFTCRIQDRPKAKEVEQETTVGIRCFTDGSKLSNGEAGAGAVLMEGEEKESITIYLGKTATVFQAEVMAITTTAERLMAKGVQNEAVAIFSDSQAALRALTKTWSANSLVTRCREVLKNLTTSNEVTLNWLPGHEGIQGNEEADTAAKEAAGTITMGPIPFAPLAKNEVQREVKEHFSQRAKERWKERRDCRQSRNAISEPKQAATERYMRLDRTGMWLLTQTVTGHILLARHAAKCRLIGDPKCPKCLEEEETAEHHVGKCRHYERERREILGKHPTTIKEVLEAGNVRTLVRYLKTTGRISEFQNELNKRKDGT